ncbi:MAG: ArsR/SmtB family transcription factor [Candidatus Woesearchaeota archaeon]
MVKDVCEINSVNKESVSYVKSKMLHEDKLYATAEHINLLNDLSRLKILNALSIKELCVCDIACLLGMTQSAVSHQLRVLRHAKYVKYRKEGKIVYYTLADANISKLLKTVIDNVR